MVIFESFSLEIVNGRKMHYYAQVMKLIWIADFFSPHLRLASAMQTK